MSRSKELTVYGSSILVKAAPSTAVLLVFNEFLKMVKRESKLATVPHALVHKSLPSELFRKYLIVIMCSFLRPAIADLVLQVGMFTVLFLLLSLNDSKAGKVVDFMKPGVDLLTLLLQAFFIPALVVSPLSLSELSG
jgi:hypothetical protein